MQELDTRPHGRIQVDPETFLKFEDGLFGFREAREFVILPGPADSPFEWLQATEISELAFIILEPRKVFAKDYKPVVAPSDLQKLKVQKIEECEIYAIVTIPRDNPKDMTANLQGPILINTETRLGRQVISLNDEHGLRTPILEQMEN